MMAIAFIPHSTTTFSYLRRHSIANAFCNPARIQIIKPTNRSNIDTLDPLQSVRCSLKLPQPTVSNIIPLVTYGIYMSHLFLQSPTGPLTPQTSFTEALQLSLNFAYITPLFLSKVAPVLHPCLEALFHVVVAWALLLLGFAAEDVRNPKGVRALPFFIGAAFLTNIFYLPYLVLRSPPTLPLTNVPNSERSSLINFAESKTLPLFSVSLVLSSLAWAVLARPEFGDWNQRLSSFQTILHTDILAYSFAVDIGVFSIFQAWLVRADANRRIWKNESKRDRLVLLSIFVPFFGLVYYLWKRAFLAPIQWQKEQEEDSVGIDVTY